MKYFFTLGNHLWLSADEIRSRLKLQNIEFTEIAQVQDFFVVGVIVFLHQLFRR